MKRRVLILGGTGAMGIYLVPELLSLGFEVIVTSRSGKGSDHASLRFVKGNAHALPFVRDVVDQTHPDAIVDFMSYSTAEFADRRDFLLASSSHYLFLSSYRVFADSSPEPLTERSSRILDVCSDEAYLATDEYALAKARQENLLRESGYNNWTILRPCITYSKNRFQLGTLEADTICFRSLQGLPTVMSREILRKQTTMTWGGDVAKMIARLVMHPSALSEDYNVVTAEHRSWQEIASVYQEIIGLQIAETDIEAYSKVAGAPYQIQYDRMYNRILDNTKVLQATGLHKSDFRSLHLGLVEELREFLKHPCYPRMDLKVNARMDVYLQTQISLRGFPIHSKTKYWLDKHFPNIAPTSRCYRRALFASSLIDRLHKRFVRS